MQQAKQTMILVQQGAFTEAKPECCVVVIVVDLLAFGQQIDLLTS